MIDLSNQEMSQPKFLIASNIVEVWKLEEGGLPQILLKFGSLRREEGGWVACEGDTLQCPTRGGGEVQDWTGQARMMW